jgi:hypothetical protein
VPAAIGLAAQPGAYLVQHGRPGALGELVPEVVGDVDEVERKVDGGGQGRRGVGRLDRIRRELGAANDRHRRSASLDALTGRRPRSPG